MDTAQEIITKMNDDRSLIEYISRYVPLYRGYKEKDVRREIDAQIRDKLFRKLHKIIDDLTWCKRELINSDQFNLGKSVEQTIIQTDILANKISHAKQGYSAIWQAIKIDTEDLSKLITYDASLFEQSKKISDISLTMKTEIKQRNVENFSQCMETYETCLIQFSNLFDCRDEIIRGISPDGGI
ncbi:hypothetical protein KSK55_02740 [Methanospirillum purgamenti]|uniref:Uncharacterized protein n=1 Tax=Methanospirillum hungatei TaxID=2203 RepID=A0A8F5ZI14_METHU|nr:hypothetical protein [Methanospirillum hungatei]QXO95338.1 hypothetical protein KSK55_02740 [Methanospirillum hungatei]